MEASRKVGVRSKKITIPTESTVLRCVDKILCSIYFSLFKTYEIQSSQIVLTTQNTGVL